MRHYRSYLIDKDGAATALPPFSFESDGAAHDHAIGLLLGQPHAAKLEVWEGSRITLSYSRSVAKTPAELRRLCYLAIAASKRETNPRARRAIAAAAYALAQEAEALADLGNGFAKDLAED